MVRSSTVSLAEPPTIVDDYKWKPSTHKSKDDSRTNPAFLLAKDRKNKEKRKSKKCDDNTNDAKSLSVDGERSEEVNTDSVKACPITNRNDNDCICTANDDDDDDEMPPPLRPAEHSNILPLTMSVLMDDKKQRHKRGKHIGKPKGTAQSTIDAEESNSEEQPLQQQQQPPEEEKKVGKKRSGGLKGKAESEGVAEGTTEKQVTTRISSDKASSETGELKPRKKKLMTRRKSNAEKGALMMSLLGEIDKMVLDYNKETPWCMGYLESEEFVSPTLKLEVPCLDDDGNNNSSGGSGKRASRVKKEGDKSELYSKEETTTTSTSTATTTTTVVKAKQEVNESAESLLLSLSLGSPRSRHGSNDIADIDIKDIDLSGIASRPHYTTSRESPHKKTSRSSSLSRSANGNISAEELLKELGRPRSISPGKIAVQNAGSGTAAAIPSPSVTATSERGDRQRPRTTVRAPPQIDGLSSSFPSESSGKRASGTRKYNMNNSQLLNCDSKELRIKKFQRLPNSSSSKSPGLGSNRDSDDNSSEERGSIRKDTRSSSSSSSSSSSKSKSKSRSRSSSGSIEAERRTERRAYNTTVTSNGDSERIIGEIVRKIKNILLVPVPKQDLPMTTKGVCAVENLVIDKGIFIDDEMLLEGLVTSVLLADSTKFADPRYVSLYEKVLKVLVVLLDRKKSTWGPISRGLCSKAKEAVLFLHIMYRNGRIYAMSLLLKMLFMAQKCAKKHGNHDLAGKIYENRGLVVLGVITKELCTEEAESEKANAAKAAVGTLQCISQMLRNKATGNTVVEEFVSILDGESLCISVFKGFDMIHGNPNLTHYALKVVDTIIPDPLPNNEVHNSQQPASSSNNISGFICGPLIEELVDTLCTEKRERTAKIALNIFRKVLPYYPTTTAALDKLCCWLSQYPHFSLDVLRVLNFEHFACARKRNPSEMQSALVELNKKYAVLGLTADLFSEPKSELVCEALRFAAFFVESLQPGEYEGGVIAKAFFADGNIQAAKVVAMVHPRDHTPATRCALRLVDALMCYDVNMKVLIANIFARVSFVQNTLEKLLCVKEGKVVVKHALSITQGLATIPNNTGNDNEFWVKPILDNAKFFKRLTKLVLIPDDFDANYVALSTLVTLFHYRISSSYAYTQSIVITHQFNCLFFLFF